jgi:hypothetical protein
MRTETEAFDEASALCAAGVLTAVRRVGLPPLGGDSELELDFLSPGGASTFSLSVGPVGAGDVHIRKGRLLDLAYAHLAAEAPEDYANTAGAWSHADELCAAWAIGAALSDPRRLQMTYPYAEIVGFSFLCTRAGEIVRRLALIGEADFLYAAELGAAELAGYALKTL